jgi:hypothetical protein
MSMQLTEFMKTAEGQQLLSVHGARFCIMGKIFESWRGAPVQCFEENLTTDEMGSIHDVDASLEQQWVRRRQRMESRFDRKEDEYSKRRVLLITQRNEMLKAIENEQSMFKSLPEEKRPAPSPALLKEIEKINSRMERISNAEAFDEIQMQKAKRQELPEEVQQIPEAVVAQSCPGCGKTPPPVHRNPDKWLGGHKLKCADWKSLKKKEELQHAAVG